MKEETVLYKAETTHADAPMADSQVLVTREELEKAWPQLSPFLPAAGSTEYFSFTWTLGLFRLKIETVEM